MNNSYTSLCLLVFTILVPWLDSMNLLNNKLDEAAFKYPKSSYSKYSNPRDVVSPSGSKMNLPVLLSVSLILCLRYVIHLTSIFMLMITLYSIKHSYIHPIFLHVKRALSHSKGLLRIYTFWRWFPKFWYTCFYLFPSHPPPRLQDDF